MLLLQLSRCDSNVKEIQHVMGDVKQKSLWKRHFDFFNEYDWLDIASERTTVIDVEVED